MYLSTPSIHGLLSILNICKVSSFPPYLSPPSPHFPSSHPFKRIPPYIPKIPMPITRLA